MSNKKYQKTLKYYCLFYLINTALFYIFFPFIHVFPPLAILGAHAPYYLLLLALLLLEANIVSPGILIGCSLITAELCFLIAFIVVCVFAFFRKKAFPFLVLTVLSNLITIVTVVFAIFLNGDAVVISGDIFCSIIGNAIWGYLLFRIICKQDGGGTLS